MCKIICDSLPLSGGQKKKNYKILNDKLFQKKFESSQRTLKRSCRQLHAGGFTFCVPSNKWLK